MSKAGRAFALHGSRGLSLSSTSVKKGPASSVGGMKVGHPSSFFMYFPFVTQRLAAHHLIEIA
jgi:hypothetical protein